MALSFEETKRIIEKVLKVSDPNETRILVHTELNLMNRPVPEFYDGVILHGPKMTDYTSGQWLDFHLKISHWRLLAEKSLMDKLSPMHRELLERSQRK